MGLVDRTNEAIPLSMHTPPIEWSEDDRAWERKGTATLEVDVDSDSSVHDGRWVYLRVFDSSEEEADIKITTEEARLLHARLGLILGIE